MSNLKEYTRIKNEILEALCCAKLNGTELAVALFVLRKTYGYNKKSDRIPLSQFMAGVSVSKRSIINALEVLKVVQILTLVQKGAPDGMASEWAFNKNIGEWRVVQKTALVQKRTKGGADSCTKVVQIPAPSKDNTKDNTKDNNKNTDWFNANGNSVEFEEFWNLYPKKEIKATAMKKWNEVVGKNGKEVLDKFKKALEWQKTYSGCFGTERQFQPRAQDYILGSRWNDENPNKLKKTDKLTEW